MNCFHAYASANRDTIAVFPSSSAVLHPFPSGRTPMITLNDLCAHLLPSNQRLVFKTLIINEPRLILVAAMMSPKATCPDCRQPTDRIHSSYVRTLADVPWATTPIELRLTVRRFFCRTCTCARQTFTERLPTVAPLYARTTPRLATAQANTGLSLGGAAGARYLTRQGSPVSRNTLLRRVRTLALPERPEPQVVGIDDWAWRKGHRYGTIVVDLERGCPIDLLEDRSAETVAAWLQSHPAVDVVARDRAEAYGAGIRQGAPEATQVADRFHLLKNVASALQTVFSAHHREIENLNHVQQHASLTRDVDVVTVPMAPPGVATTRAQQQIEQNRARRVAEYAQVRDFHQQGWTMKAIATHVGRHHRTVKKYLQASTFPERPPRRRPPSILDPYKAYLLERWNAGCHSALELCRDIQAQGFRGQYSIVADYVSRFRPAQGRVSKHRKSGSPATIVEADKPLTPCDATWLVMRREAKLNDKEKQQLARLQGQEGEMAEAITLTQDFAALVRQRQPEYLETWLERATASGLQAFKSFANGLRADDDAVKAGVTLSWSTGPVEGQINRLKMLKRQMYGRANIGLLRQRVLLPT
jgi:transposase